MQRASRGASWLFAAVLAIAASAVPVEPAHALTIVLSAVDRGTYDQSGFHDPNSLTYTAGWNGSAEFRNFVVWDLGSVSASLVILSAEVSYEVETIAFTDPSEDVTLTHVATSHPLLQAGGAGKLSHYADLGDGSVYGSRTIFPGDAGTEVTISLNAAAVADLNAAIGSTFAIGGYVSTLDSVPGEPEGVFANSATAPPQGLMILTAIPEPSGISLLGIGLAALAVLRRRVHRT